MNIAVLIPCLNEEKAIRKVVEDFARELPEAGVYVFDNNSSDHTASEATEAGAKVYSVRSKGKGNVIAAMFRKIEADFYVMVDGDDTYPAERARDLLAPVILEECDMVVGQRIPVEGTSPFPAFHRMGNRLISKIINFFFKSNIQDVFSGYRAFNKKIVYSLPLLSTGFETETELTLQALDKRFQIKEVEVSYRPRSAGSHSKLNTYHDGWLVLKTILTIIKDYKPLLFFSLISLVCFILSLGCGSVIIGEYLRLQRVYHVSTAVLATGLMITSLLSLTTGLVLDSTKRHYAEYYTLLMNSILRSERGEKLSELNTLSQKPTISKRMG